MIKICPLSMSGESPKQCKRSDCIGWTDGQCFLNRITLSMYFIAKDLGRISYDIEEMKPYSEEF